MPIEHYRFSNGRDVPLELVLEPWGMPLMIEPAATVVVEVHSEAPGVLEVDLVGPANIVIGCWSGCRVRVTAEGEEIYSTLDGPAVPGVPEGQTVRSFIKGLFGE